MKPIAPRAAITYITAIAVTVGAAFATGLHAAPSRRPAVATLPARVQPQKAPKTYGVFFPKVTVPLNAGISVVRVIATCGQIAAITRIPRDWYVRTLRPALENGPEWSDHQFAWSAVELAAGHGVTRLAMLHSLDGAIRVTVEDPTCFDLTADVQDDLGEIAWKTRLRRTQLRLRP